MVIDSNGNVGIGATSVEDFGGGHVTLEVAGSTTSEGGVFKTATSDSAGSGSSGTEMIMFTDSTNGGSINVVSSDDLRLMTANTARMTVTSGGNVGINTTTPASLFEVKASALNRANGIALRGSGANDVLYIYPSADNVATIEHLIDGTTNTGGVLTINPQGGNVGIGTTGPQTALHLYGGDNSTSLLTLDDTGTGGGRKWSFRPGDPVTPSNGYFSFRDETAGQNRIVITDGGEVRVGHGLATTQIRIQAGGSVCRTFGSTSGSGFHFTTNAIYPTNFAGSLYDANVSLGSGSYRYATIFATNGTINTSDENEKQDIENLSDAERTVATAIKGLIKKFRFIDAVEKKGDDARIHVGVIAQDVEQAFVDAGLDPRRYGMFCEDIWYEVDGETNPDEPYTEDTPNAVRKVRLGIRYDELLAFVISAL
jgi:hypothetical protein